MLKQAIIYLLLSIAIVIFANYAHLLIIYIDLVYAYINVTISPVFNSGRTGTVIRNVLTLVLIPVIIVGIPALIYRAIKGHHMPYFVEVTWLLWLILVLSKVLIH